MKRSHLLNGPAALESLEVAFNHIELDISSPPTGARLKVPLVAIQYSFSIEFEPKRQVLLAYLMI